MKRLLISTLLVYFCGLAGITEARWVHRPKHTTVAGSGPQMTTANYFNRNTAHPNSLHANHNKGISSSSSSPPSAAVDTMEVVVKEKLNDTLEVKDDYCSYHPVAVKRPRIIEQYDRRSPDGLYEYRYVLSNGVTHYERAYWKPLGYGEKILARKGFYSYRLAHDNFITVYYTADDNGFQQDPAKYSQTQPVLPKHLPVSAEIESTVMDTGEKVEEEEEVEKNQPKTKT